MRGSYSGPYHWKIPSNDQLSKAGRPDLRSRMCGHDFGVEMEQQKSVRSGCGSRFPGQPGREVPVSGEVFRQRALQYKKIAPFCKGNQFVAEGARRDCPGRPEVEMCPDRAEGCWIHSGS